MKLGVYEPEADAVCRVRKALGPDIRLHIDPNRCWSLPTAKRMLKCMEQLDLEYVEEPTKLVPARVPNTTQAGVPRLAAMGLAHLRQSTQTPIAAGGTELG